MKIKFLGTAAAEGIPSFFCECEVCRKARELGGENLRSRAQALIDGKLLLDFGPDTYYHFTQYKIASTDIEHCLITHIHEDHLNEKELIYLNTNFGHSHDGYTFTLHGSCDLAFLQDEILKKAGEKLKLNMVKPFVPFKAGEYTVTALKAWHGTENPFVYLITDGKKTLLYGNDSDIFPEESWEYLEKNKVHIDVAVLDCTNANDPAITYRGHMGMIQNRECKQRLLEIGSADENTTFVLHHFSHNGKDCLYDDFKKIAEAEGFAVSYDSMEIDF